MPVALMVLLLPQMTAIVMVLIFMDNHHFFLCRFIIRGCNCRTCRAAYTCTNNSPSLSAHR